MKYKLHSTTTVRDTCNSGLLQELEYGLLKQSRKSLGWNARDKSILLDMRIDHLQADAGSKQISVIVRSMCHSQAVTVDYLSFAERFNMKQCILILGDLGNMPNSWAQLIAPATALFQRGFNVLWVDVPQFASDGIRWCHMGPSIIAGAMRMMQVDRVSVVASGAGGSVFLNTLTQHPTLFGRTHFCYNLSLPQMKSLPYDLPGLENVLRKGNHQLWFGFHNEEDFYDRFAEGMPSLCYDAVTKAQTRLEGERRRGRRNLAFDEVLITEDVNLLDSGRVSHVKFGMDNLYCFSEEMLGAVQSFLEQSPNATQEEIGTGLAGGSALSRELAASKNQPRVDPELTAVKKLRLRPAHVRRALADDNRRRMLERFHDALLQLPELPNPKKEAREALKALQQSQSGPLPTLRQLKDQDDDAVKRLQDWGFEDSSASRMSVLVARGELEADEDEDSFFGADGRGVFSPATSDMPGPRRKKSDSNAGALGEASMTSAAFADSDSEEEEEEDNWKKQQSVVTSASIEEPTSLGLIGQPKIRRGSLSVGYRQNWESLRSFGGVAAKKKNKMQAEKPDEEAATGLRIFSKRSSLFGDRSSSKADNTSSSSRPNSGKVSRPSSGSKTATGR
eukprot:TRINITY_DN6493_c0_g1_i1.p1 TRINITY_DN6493_c0_g1~~TRINITY_DN6493_c0_g1_i1.p1  ORF type:complete len:620 (+),score=175.75 TRINITY_DN6493_c0_g1_i1:71-1930(+)